MASSGEASQFSRQYSLCCDPFKCHKQRKTQGLRKISAQLVILHPSLGLQIGDKVCTTCRKKLSSLPITGKTEETYSQQETAESTGVSGNESEGFVPPPEHELLVLNSSLSVLGESPVMKKKLSSSAKYAQNKLAKVHKTVKKRLKMIAESTGSEEEEEMMKDYESEIISQLKEKFQICTKKK